MALLERLQTKACRESAAQYHASALACNVLGDGDTGTGEGHSQQVHFPPL